MPHFIHNGGSFKAIKRQWIKHEGAWKVIKKAWIKHNDIWEEFYRPLVVIDVTTSQANYNLHNAVVATGYWDGVAPVDVLVTVKAGVILSASSGFAFDTGTFPPGSTLKLVIEAGAFIAGRGGDGGSGGAYGTGSPGGNGIDAMRVQYPISIDNQGGIWGGGGGGGGGNGSVDDCLTFSPDGTERHTTIRLLGGGGGGGQGAPNSSGGSGYNYGQPGTINALGFGGAGANVTSCENGTKTSGAGGNGGAQGQPGSPGVGGAPGGQPGRAIVGIANVTWINMGSVLGATV